VNPQDSEADEAKVWHIRMRHGKGGADLSSDGITHGYIGINCRIRDKDFNPSHASEEDLRQLERWNKWSRNQLTNFINLKKNTLILLSPRESRFLAVGVVERDAPYLEPRSTTSASKTDKVDK